jgi:hypothetical protein
MLQGFATQHEIKRSALNEMMPLASLNEICHMNLYEPQSEWITAHVTLLIIAIKVVFKGADF